MSRTLDRRYSIISSLALLGFNAAFALDVKPLTATDAVSDGLAFTGIFSLGATGLAILQMENVGFISFALSAVVLSVFSLARASIDRTLLVPIGILDFVSALGLFAWAFSVSRPSSRPEAPPRGEDHKAGPW